MLLAGSGRAGRFAGGRLNPPAGQAGARALAREIHVWLVDVDRWAAQHGSGDALLSAEESEAAGSFRAAPLRERYVVAHGALRVLLSRYARTAPQAWKFRRTRYGRPEIAGRSRLRFSLSYGHGLVALAFTRQADLGVDIAWTGRRVDARRIAERAFAPGELADLRSLRADAARARFFDYWTLKEAYAKAIGRGFWASPRGYAFALAGGPGIGFRPPEPEDVSQWQFALATVAGGHRLALAARTGARAPRRVVAFSAPGERPATLRELRGEPAAALASRQGWREVA